ncbi:MAG: hypothetical protein ABI383_16495 [Acidobacteriaceae bacterium]
MFPPPAPSLRCCRCKSRDPKKTRRLPLSTPKKRILWSSDESLQRQLSCGIALLADSWDSYFVSQSGKLLSTAIAFRPHLIILNAYDPSLHGFEACRRLRGIPCLASIPVVLVMRSGDLLFHALAQRLQRTSIMEAPLGGMRMLEELQALVSACN